MQVEEIFLRGKNQRKTREFPISLLDDYYYFSKIQLVVYYQYCILIGWATSRLFVIAH